MYQLKAKISHYHPRNHRIHNAKLVCRGIPFKRSVGCPEVQNGVNLGAHKGHPYINLIKFGTNDFSMKLLKLIPMAFDPFAPT